MASRRKCRVHKASHYKSLALEQERSLLHILLQTNDNIEFKRRNEIQMDSKAYKMIIISLNKFITILSHINSLTTCIYTKLNARYLTTQVLKTYNSKN